MELYITKRKQNTQHIMYQVNSFLCKIEEKSLLWNKGMEFVPKSSDFFLMSDKAMLS